MTAITHYRPSTDLSRLRRNVDGLFRDFFGSAFGEGELGHTNVTWRPRVDISETDDVFLIEADLPGLKKQDVQVTFENGVLHISGERNEEHTEGNPLFHRIERVHGRFSRSLNLGMAVKSDRIKASFENGVLLIEIPKADEIKPMQITIS